MRTLPDPGFAGDDGAADPALATALAAYAGATSDAEAEERHLVALQALQDARLLVPVVAVLGESEVDEAGLTHDKSSDMAAVLMRGRDGRTALLAFTGSAAMQAWDPQARPVPVAAPLAAQSAVQDGASALLVDVAGPATLVVETEGLRHLAAGRRLVRVEDGWGWLGEADADSP